MFRCSTSLLHSRVFTHLHGLPRVLLLRPFRFAWNCAVAILRAMIESVRAVIGGVCLSGLLDVSRCFLFCSFAVFCYDTGSCSFAAWFRALLFNGVVFWLVCVLAFSFRFGLALFVWSLCLFFCSSFILWHWCQNCSQMAPGGLFELLHLFAPPCASPRSPCILKQSVWDFDHALFSDKVSDITSHLHSRCSCKVV